MSTQALYDDKALLGQMAQGSEQAFALLYNQYRHLLFVHIYRKLQDEDEARDVVQEIFLNLWERRNSLQIKDSLSAYLYNAARYRIINRISKQLNASRYIDHFQAFVNSYAEGTDHRVRERMLTALLEKEIEQLPTKMRQVFELSRKEGLSHKEIAERLNITEQSVRSHVKNALHILRPKFNIYLLAMLLLRQ
ncbi:RNA polymerase sigma factor [Pedobacter nanyangensis]|uniref:RNA polymerase sigma factor n=1 Tax=Pedobacter nanyangensis TaxID=1562389 RepID=UPI000DE33245|nr:RNA polymerase sigma-70 factor [Pedobacter nanyangensis]